VDAKPVHAYFCTARSTLTPVAQSALEEQIASWKTQAAGREIVVTGYADTRGTSAFNAQLAASRADFVAGLLRSHGLSVVEATGVGELEGLDDGVNCANQRRVDIAIRGTNATPSRACGLPQEVVALSCS
jgi:outer membrane protein OmpA-like peptidoglycan-associated protein